MTRLWWRTWRDYATMVETLALATTIELALTLVPFSRLLSRLDRLATGTTGRTTRSLSRLRLFVTAAYRLLPVEKTCLRESLVLYALLRRRGVAAKLRLGVAKDGQRLTAHAWVECADAGECQESHPFRTLLPAALDN